MAVGGWGGGSEVSIFVVVFIAPLHLEVDDSLLSLIDLIDFMILVYIFHFPVFAICCLNLSIWIAYVGVGRCCCSSMMV